MTYVGQVYVAELGRTVDLYDHPDNVPDDYAGSYAGVPQDTLPGAALGQQCYARAISAPAGLAPHPYVGNRLDYSDVAPPGAFPWAIALIAIAVIVVTVSVILYLIMSLNAMTSSSSSPVGPTYVCPEGTPKAGTECRDSVERFGSTFYTYDCCSGAFTKRSEASSDWLSLILLGAVGLGAIYVGIKYILPALTEGSKRPWNEQGYVTKGYTKLREQFR